MLVGPAELPQVDLRLGGYRAVLHKHGLATDDGLICAAHFTGDSAYACVADAIDTGVKFDAIFAASDGIALSAIRAIKAAGLWCPNDVAAIGFDDTETAVQSRPTLPL